MHGFRKIYRNASCSLYAKLGKRPATCRALNEPEYRGKIDFASGNILQPPKPGCPHYDILHVGGRSVLFWVHVTFARDEMVSCQSLSSAEITESWGLACGDIKVILLKSCGTVTKSVLSRHLAETANIPPESALQRWRVNQQKQDAFGGILPELNQRRMQSSASAAKEEVYGSQTVLFFDQRSWFSPSMNDTKCLIWTSFHFDSVSKITSDVTNSYP